MLKTFKELLIFSGPIILGQLGQMMFGMGDIFVAGRYSHTTVAAMGVAEGFFVPFMLLGLSANFSVSALTSQTRAAGTLSPKLLGSALTMAILTSLPLMALIWPVVASIHLFGFDASLQPLIAEYLGIISFTLLPMYIYQVLKEYLQALDRTYVANALILLFNLINIGLCIIMMFGLWGCPELGIKGAAYATLITRSLMALSLFIYTYHNLQLRQHGLPVEWALVLRLWRLGIPIGLGALSEVLVFSTVTLLIGKMDVLASASHNIVLKYASFTFMIPYALASAATVKVGAAFGRKDPKQLKKYAQATLLLAATVMSATSILYFCFPEQLVRIATPDPALIRNGTTMLFFVALFQIPDGLQVSLWGILRGMNITTRPMIICILANWFIGLPLGYFMAYHTDMKAQGLWAGLAIGLSLMALMLGVVLLRAYQHFNKQHALGLKNT